MTKRIEFIDLAKGFCILMVVLLHLGEVINIMSFFRMPLYFVLSGMFFKTYGSLWKFIKKKTNKLLIPFFCSFLLTTIPTTFMLNKINGFNSSIYALLFTEHGRFNIDVNTPLWFLICLFAVNLIFYIIFLLCHHSIIAITLIGGVCGIAGYTLSIHGIHLPMWTDSALTALPFFIIGFGIKQYSNILYEKFSNKDLFSLIGAFIVLFAIYIINEYNAPVIIVFMNNEFNIDIISLYIGGLAGTYYMLLIAKYFTYLPIISYLGKYSIVVLLTHKLYILIIRNILYQLHVPQDSFLLNMGIFLLIIAISLPTIKLCTKYLPYCFAQKDLWK